RMLPSMTRLVFDGSSFHRAHQKRAASAVRFSSQKSSRERPLSNSAARSIGHAATRRLPKTRGAERAKKPARSSRGQRHGFGRDHALQASSKARSSIG